VLPVRIHDLDPEDVKLTESYLGPIRAVEFVYHSPGVNRSLRPWDDDVIKNTKQPFYRDQINKVANAIDEILRGMKQAERKDSSEKTLPIVEKGNKEVVEKPISHKLRKKNFSASFIRAVIFSFIAIALAAAGFFGLKWYQGMQNIERAKFVLLPAIQKSVQENFRPPFETYQMAMEARKIIPTDSAFIKCRATKHFLDGVLHWLYFLQ